MAIVTEFDANFNKLTAAVASATLTLKSFTTDTDKVNASLSRMTDSFSGAKVIQQGILMTDAIEKVGGVSKLTTKELQQIAPTLQEAIDKAKLMGLEVPANLQKINESVQGQLSWIRTSAGVGKTAITEVTAETTKATSAFAGMSSVTQQLGTMIAGAFTINTLVNFGKSVLNTADAIVKMSDQTGLTIDEVQRLQYVSGQTSVSMESMVSAAQNVTAKLGEGDAGLTGAFKKLNINAEDFKKLDTYEQFMTLAGAIGNVKDPTEKAAAAAAIFGKNWKEIFPVLNNQMKQLADDATVASDKTIKTIDNLGDRIAAAQGRLTSWASTGLSAVMTGIESAASGYYELGAAVLNAGHGFETITQQLERYGRENDETASPSASRLNATIQKIPPHLDNAIAGFKMTKLSVDQLKDAEKAHASETAASMAEHKAHVDAEKDAYTALAAEFKKYQDAVDALTDRIKGNDVADVAGKWSTALAAVGDNVGRLSSKMRDELAGAMREAIDAMARNGTLTDAQSSRYTELLVKVEAYNASLKAQATVELPAASGTVTDYTQKLYDAAVAEDKVRDALGKKTDALNDATKAYQQATYSMSSQYSTGDLADQAARTGGSIATDSYGNKYVYIPGVNAPPPHRAAGGPVTAGASYVVGERGPELFTPAASGMISPNGAGGVAVHNTFYLTDTESNLARRVSEAIMRSVTQARRV